MSGIGINRLRNIAKNEFCRFSIHVGARGKILIKVDEFKKWLAGVDFI